MSARITLEEIEMLVELRSLKPNPMRDFTVDPMDDDRIEELRQSIEEDGFWGGIVCRRSEDGTIQIAAGHTRVKAAIAAGIREADLFVGNGDMDDATMIRIYARENATQRGNLGTAQAGSVASALRFVAKMVLCGVSQEFLRNADIDKIRGNLTSDKGLGQTVIVQFLDGVPGINDGTVQQALANLKASGDYARIIQEVQAEIERENAEALKALEAAEREQRQLQLEREEAEERQRQAEAARKEANARAKAAKEQADRKRAEEDAKRAKLDRQRAEEQAKLNAKRRKEADEEMKKFDATRKTRDTAAKAVTAATTEAVKDAEGNPTGKRAERKATFDFEGVAKHLKNAHQIDAFRQCVTGQGVAPSLPVANQAALAEHLVKLATSRKKELSAAFIRENVITLALNVKGEQRELDKEEREKLYRRDLTAKAKQYLHDFARSCNGMASYGEKIADLLKTWPKGLAFPITGEFRSSLESAKRVIDTLYERT
jgi:hypothetical protein